MKVIEALRFSSIGKAKISPTSLELPNGFEAQLVEVESEDGTMLYRAEITGPELEWTPFSDLPIHLKRRIIEADWESVDPKHPLEWLAEQATDDDGQLA